VVLDAPLLLESGLPLTVFTQPILVISAPEAIQIDRLTARDKCSPEEARQMITAQWPLSQKRALADIVIDNDGSVEQLAQKIDVVWKRYLA
jgi:dephospho-CoA kinase